MKCFPRKFISQKGFSLVEMILVMTVMTAIAVASASIFQPILDSWALGQTQAETADTVGYAITRMKNEMTQIHDEGCVITATSTRFRFMDDAYLDIDYKISGGNLMRGTNVLVRNVQSITFTYYGSNNAVIATPTVSPSQTNIWAIKISISIMKNGQRKTIETTVHPRNFTWA